VDASLNNYVALHYESRHMSWLHCMWGIGSTLGPYIMGKALTAQLGWQNGYRIIGGLQVVLMTILFISLPLWTKSRGGAPPEQGKALSLREIVKIKGVWEAMIFFFGYCAFEQAAGLWASSFLNISKGVPPDLAASLGALFFIGITVGRALSGFLTLLFSDRQMIVFGLSAIALGILLFLLPLGPFASFAGLVTIGLGCAPLYPSMIHATPGNFGADRSQAIIGVQMASAYAGTLLMPPLFGFLAEYLGISFLPYYFLTFLLIMAAAFVRLTAKTKQGS